MPAGNITSAVAPSSCNAAMTPKCIQQLYGIPRTSASQSPASESSNKLAVSGYLKQFVNENDLRVCANASNSVPKIKLVVSFQEFLRKFTNLPLNTTFTLQTIDGGINSQDPQQAGIEAVSAVSLHQHQITRTDAGLKRTLTYNTRSEWRRACRLSSYLSATIFKTAILRVHWTSSTFCSARAHHHRSSPPATTRTKTPSPASWPRTHRALLKPASHQPRYLARYAIRTRPSGPEVSASSSHLATAVFLVHKAHARSSSLLSRLVAHCPSFSPSLVYPRSHNSDFLFRKQSVTSVGATQNVNPETSAPFSSGGFSNYFPTPSYQTAAKAAYLDKLGNTYEGRFNVSGRGFPDVAAAGTNFEIVWEGGLGTVDGTSCSSPVFASVVSLLNGLLIAAGKPVLGFLNPFLYSTGAGALNDITIGSNPGCNTSGFPATAGWDPVSVTFCGQLYSHSRGYR